MDSVLPQAAKAPRPLRQRFDNPHRVLALLPLSDGAAAAAAELVGEHPLATPRVHSSGRLQQQGAALASRTFAEEVKPEVVATAVAQARREATPLLNTPRAAKGRYAGLTPLEPRTAELRRENPRRREDQHKEWHAQRALEPTLDALHTEDREIEPVDTRADADACTPPHLGRAADPLEALAASSGSDATSVAGEGGWTAWLALGGQLRMAPTA